jgi:hypothetical protein
MLFHGIFNVSCLPVFIGMKPIQPALRAWNDIQGTSHVEKSVEALVRHVTLTQRDKPHIERV